MCTKNNKGNSQNRQNKEVGERISEQNNKQTYTRVPSQVKTPKPNIDK